MLFFFKPKTRTKIEKLGREKFEKSRFSIGNRIISEKTVANKALTDNPAPQPHAKARRRGVCVSAIVLRNKKKENRSSIKQKEKK
jgi:hypothetical protein